VILGQCDGTFDLQGHATPQHTQLNLVLRGATVELNDDDLSGVQSLARNGDIRFTDEKATKPARAGDDSGDTPEPTMTIHVDASDPMWVRRSDFSVELTAKLDLALQEGPPEITGTIGLRRGIVELMGQSFDIERGQIQFAGGHRIEPVLDLTASRRVPGGSKVTIQASGTLRAPDLQFTVDDRAVTAGEALAALTGTRGSGDGGTAVQQQLGSMASGIAAGFLTLGARRQFGEWVPVIEVEGGAETRVRAGIEARRLIPRALRRFIVDAYVEGLVTSGDENRPQSESESSSATRAGVEVELRFPHSFVGEAQYGPGQRWSADLSWEP